MRKEKITFDKFFGGTLSGITESGKKMTFNANDVIGFDYYNSNVGMVVFYPDGNIKALMIDNIEYRVKSTTTKPVPSKSANTTSHFPKQVSHEKEVREYHFAPYNFVPLNKQVVAAPQVGKKLWGSIEIELLAKTDFFIRNNAQNKRAEETEFCNRNGNKLVPGSSVSGLLANTVEILSFGSIQESIENKRLYFRNITVAGDQQDAYFDALTEGQDRDRKYTGDMGIMYFEKGSYKIAPLPDGAWDTKRSTGRIADWENKRISDTRWQLYTGSIGGKKAYYEYNPLKADRANAIKIRYSDLEAYRNDKNRKVGKKDFDFLDRLKKDKQATWPVFYTTYTDYDGDQRTAFGHTKYFRIPYSKTIKNAAQQKVGKEDDFRQSMWGNKEHAGKLHFQDLLFTKGEFYTSPIQVKALGQPQPTSFQLYLDQGNGNTIHRNKKDLSHWSNTDAEIRGYKNYWHRKADWQFKDAKIEKHLPAPIQPAKPGTTFCGTLHFNGITKEELGALLFAIELQPESCHKMGMAKPYMGSVKLAVKHLAIKDSKTRYSSVFSDNSSWNTGQTKVETTSFIAAYKKYMTEVLGTSYMEVPRINDFFNITKFDEKKISDSSYLANTDYPGHPSKFRHRLPLHYIKDIDKLSKKENNSSRNANHHYEFLGK